MDDKEINLSVEEMKNAVSMAVVLPSLFNAIDEIKKKVEDVNTNLTKQASALNTYSTRVGNYINSVTNLISKFDSKDTANILNEIKELNKQILQSFKDIQVSQKDSKESDETPKIDLSKDQTATKKPQEIKKTPEVEQKPLTSDDISYYKILLKLLGLVNAKQQVNINTPSLKVIYQCNDAVAERIQAWFIKYKAFDRKKSFYVISKALPPEALQKGIRECKAALEKK